MPGKQAAIRRMEAAEHLLESARALAPIPAALMAVYKPQFDTPADMVVLLKRIG